ncbi:MAG: aspartate kinase [Eubacteriales bacterium]|nr:aspartate kinase [Eubacteriales bacterium]
MLKVAKFGGSSLASSEQFAKVKEIVTADDSRNVIVVSAPGKRFSGDHKVTDLLYLCHAHLKYEVSYEPVFEIIEGRYCEIASSCGLSLDLDEEFAKIKAEMHKGMPIDYLVSRGEYLNSKLMAEYLGYEFIDSCEWLFFGFDGKVDFSKTQAALKEIIAIHNKIVLPGFYGCSPNGSVKVFSRGGSDISGAIAAAVLDADAYENWTDVPGILMADPRIVDNPKSISQVTFSELRELSYMGADVLHQETVFPVRKNNIPLYIKDTNNYAAEGTLIMEDFPPDPDESNFKFITGISGKKSYTIISINKSGISDSTGYIRRVLEIMERYKINIEHIPCSIDNFSLVISSETPQDRIPLLIADITKECDPDSIKLTPDISIIAVVGRRMAYRPGVSGQLFKALGDNNINIRMIEQGADEINIMVGVEDHNFEKAIRVLYHSFT